MNVVPKETLFSWLWRKTHKENLLFLGIEKKPKKKITPPPPLPIIVIILYLLSFQSL